MRLPPTTPRRAAVAGIVAGLALVLATSFLSLAPAAADDTNPVGGACEASFYFGVDDGIDPYVTASPNLPHGTRIRVSHGAKSVVVRVTDWGPYVRGRCLDISEEAFAVLAPLSAGVIPVTYEVLADPPEQKAAPVAQPPTPATVPSGFDAFLTLSNPGTKPATVTVRYLGSGGDAAAPAVLSVGPGARSTVNVNDVVGPNREVAIDVSSDQPIVAERPMYFHSGGRTGGHVASGQAPSTRRYFADGATITGFDTYYVLANPGPATTATIRYLGIDGPIAERRVELPAASRITVNAADHIGLGVVAGAVVEAAAPIAVERPMYFDYRVTADGGHVSSGASEPATTAVFAEGRTGNGFDTYIVLVNPGTSAASAVVTAIGPHGPAQRKLDVPAGARRALAINELVPSGDVAIEVASNLPVVAERSTYFDTTIPGVGAVTGGHTSAGIKGPAPEWHFSEGHTGDGFHEYLTLFNPSSEDAMVKAALTSNDGGEWSAVVAVPARSRRTIDVDAVVGPGRDVAATVTSAVPIVAERPMYFSYKGVWDGGHASPGVTTPSTRVLFAEGYTG